MFVLNEIAQYASSVDNKLNGNVNLQSKMGTYNLNLSHHIWAHLNTNLESESKPKSFQSGYGLLHSYFREKMETKHLYAKGMFPAVKLSDPSICKPTHVYQTNRS